ncbi:MAG TPA: hypothetical protein VJN01_00030, partial [Xanthomonadales bacterium]|nr:hypothetical protein [Xanthomonadales bacterium]
MPMIKSRAETTLLAQRILLTGIIAAHGWVVGIILVNAPEGWVVVGLGRNGMKYSVLLVFCLLGLAYQQLPERHTG